MSDNCDQNFGTFDDFGVKNYQKVSHNMILMSRHKGQLHGEKRANKFGQGPPRHPPSPHLANAQKKTFLGGEVFPYCYCYCCFLMIVKKIYNLFPKSRYCRRSVCENIFHPRVNLIYMLFTKLSDPITLWISTSLQLGVKGLFFQFSLLKT